jgi:hypothetical protein
MKSALHSLIPFLPFLLNHFRLPTLSILSCNCPLRNAIPAARDPRYITSGRPPTENTASSIVAYWFTVAEICLSHGCVSADPQRLPLATPLILLRDVTAYVLTQSLHSNRCMRHVSWHLFYCCMRTLPSNGCFSASTVLVLSKCATVFRS